MNKLPIIIITGLLLPILLMAKPIRTFSDCNGQLDRLQSARLALALLENNCDSQITYLLNNPLEIFVLRTTINPENTFDFHNTIYPANRELFDSTFANECFQYINKKIEQLDTVICVIWFTQENFNAGKEYLMNTRSFMPFNSVWFQTAWERRDSANDKRSPREFLQHWADSVIKAPIKTLREPWNYNK